MKKLLLSAIIIFCASILSAQPIDVNVSISSGKIQGYLNSTNDIAIFKGIPFAEPPVGELRWKVPIPVKSWTGVKICNKFAASPMQSTPAPFFCWTEEFLIPKEPISEDCLYLNVWSGAKTVDDKLPVIVWIYGGGFEAGGAAVPIYDGEQLAKKEVVFVSFNYRVNIFGFSALPDLAKESGLHSSGNYGLADQIEALRWVKANIDKFGGDPNNVTIAGQSAGAMSVTLLMGSPLAKGLFHKAIAESGSALRGGISYNTVRTQEEQGVIALKSGNISGIDELRKMTAQDIYSKVKGFFRPVADNILIPFDLAKSFESGIANDIPFLTGYNAQDGIVFEKETKDEFKTHLSKKYGKNSELLAAEYLKDSTDVYSAQIALSRDEMFALPTKNLIDVLNKKNKNLYLYYFKHIVPAETGGKEYKAFHTGEVPYALGTLPLLKRELSKTDYYISEQMQSYWVNFAKTGNPNGGSLPEWKKYSPEHGTSLMIDDEIRTEENTQLKKLRLLTEKGE